MIPFILPYILGMLALVASGVYLQKRVSEIPDLISHTMSFLIWFFVGNALLLLSVALIAWGE